MGLNNKALILATGLCLLAHSAFAAPWNAPHVPGPYHVDKRGNYLRRFHDRHLESPPWTNYTQKEYWFTEQRLDHFNMADRRTYSQRYFVIDDFFTEPDGPILLHVCGEYTCPGIMPARLFPLEVAYKHGALVVSVEHRFFGKSLPFEELTEENLQYSNSRQALNDLAYFTQWFQKNKINKPFGLSEDHKNKWVTVGGSYPGALAAWYRIKFPHLTLGAHSSSGVVNAIYNFTQFDKQVATSAGQECADALRTVTKNIESNMPSVKDKFDASFLEDNDFYLLVADSAAEAVQYGHTKVVCSAVTPPYKAGNDPLPAFISFTNDFFFAKMGNSPKDYDSNTWKSPTKGGNSRSWWWQKCSELSWMQTAPSDKPIRSTSLTMNYFEGLCKKLFDISFLPGVNETNNYYGGTNVGGSTNIFFANGVEDPWQWAGVRSSQGPTLPAEVVDCEGCAHCVDLYTPTDSDPTELKNERQKVLDAYEQWLS
eukprot:gb/GECG01012064.1/.p1 GENE.gb/GECG01012064.1/~~gb/GECG01012064.1/.p1  ORF type:complete len:483 (+),score=41.85 gb/GECG01012064.1/:1-1449(+)